MHSIGYPNIGLVLCVEILSKLMVGAYRKTLSCLEFIANDLYYFG